MRVLIRVPVFNFAAPYILFAQSKEGKRKRLETMLRGEANWGRPIWPQVLLLIAFGSLSAYWTYMLGYNFLGHRYYWALWNGAMLWFGSAGNTIQVWWSLRMRVLSRKMIKDKVLPRHLPVYPWHPIV